MSANARVTILPVSATDAPDQTAGRLFRLSIGVFFVGGFLSSVISLFVPRMTLIYGLDYTRALLIQLAFHTSYLLFAIPIARAIMRLGYMRSATTGLSIMAAACVVFLWSQGLRSYALVLFALLALSAGITFLQIASNTVVAVMGDARGAAFRLNLLQAFNAVGTVAGPLIGAHFLLGNSGGTGVGSVEAIAPPFVFAIVLLAALAAAFWLNRDLLHASVQAQTARARFDWPALLANRKLIAGAGAIFVYVGAEVSIGALLPNYLVLPQVIHTDAVTAGRLVSLYWGGAMIGRAVGAFAMKRIAPRSLLIAAAIAAALLTVIAATAHGAAGAVALIAVGLCNSIMYPTIYVLALPRAPELATPGATLLCMAVVGGAVVPLLTGLIADGSTLAAALLLPALCYLAIAAFARAQVEEGC